MNHAYPSHHISQWKLKNSRWQESFILITFQSHPCSACWLHACFLKFFYVWLPGASNMVPAFSLICILSSTCLGRYLPGWAGDWLGPGSHTMPSALSHPLQGVPTVLTVLLRLHVYHSYREDLPDPGDQIHVSWISRLVPYHWATWETLLKKDRPFRYPENQCVNQSLLRSIASFIEFLCTNVIHVIRDYF